MSWKDTLSVYVDKAKFHTRKLALAGTVAVSSIGGARAALADDLTNVSTVISSVTTWVTDIMAVFMEPPLVIFIGLGIGFLVIRQVKKLMRR